MPKAEFARINAEREEAGLPLYANPRNSGAGLAPPEGPGGHRQPAAVGLVLPADRGRCADRRPASRPRSSGWRPSASRSTPTARPGSTSTAVIAFTERWREARHDLPYETDGVVVKVDRFDQQSRLGMVAPGAALGDRLQVPARAGRDAWSRTSSRTSAGPGRSRRSPTCGRSRSPARRSPGRPSTTSTRSGARTSGSATTSILQKAGDVIPEVVRPIVEQRTGAEREFEMPATCPVCGTPIVRDEGAVRHYCPNLACPARVGQEFGHFAGRGGMDIEGAGWAVHRAAPPARPASSAAGDFYRLTVEDLESLDRFARKSAENLYAAIQRSRRRPLERVIAALGIPQVGWTTAIDLAAWLAEQVPTDGEPMAVRLAGRGALRHSCATTARDQPERFEEVEGVGPTVAASLAAGSRRRGRRRSARRPGRRRRRARAAGSSADRRPRPAARPARRSSSRARSRASAARRPRRRSGRPAASPAGRSRGRPTTWSPARTPARSSPRRRSSASRSSTRTASGACSPARHRDRSARAARERPVRAPDQRRRFDPDHPRRTRRRRRRGRPGPTPGRAAGRGRAEGGPARARPGDRPVPARQRAALTPVSRARS